MGRSSDNENYGYVHNTGTIKLNRNGVCQLRFVVQSRRKFVQAICLNKNLFESLKAAEKEKVLVNFHKPIGEKYHSLYQGSRISLADSADFEWKLCDLKPEFETCAIADIYLGKVTEGTVCYIEGSVVAKLPREYRGNKSIDIYYLRDSSNLDILIKKWEPEEAMELEELYRVKGKINVYRNQTFIVVTNFPLSRP